MYACMYVWVHVTLVVCTDCESCMRPSSTNPRSMEAGEYGLTRGTCFVARRLEVVAVVWIPWCVLYVSRGISFFSRFLYFERTRPTASTRQPCLVYLSTSTGVRTACHYLFSLSFCVCNIRRLY